MKIGNGTEINRFTLRFRKPDTESAFRGDYFAKTITQLRWNLLLGAFLYGVLGVIDYLTLTETRGEAWFIRYCIVCPTVLAVFLLSFTKHFQKLMQPLLTLGGLIAGAGAVRLSMIAPASLAYVSFTGILLCLIFYYTFVGLRFATAAMLSWSIVLLYQFTVGWQSGTPGHFQAHDILVLLSFNITGMWGSYVRERYMLYDFLHRRVIQEQKEELGKTLQEAETARREAETSSRLDPLTNLYNRRHFFSIVDGEIDRAQRHSACLSLIILDIDHFKSVNDTHGHHAGDAVLTAAAEIIRSGVRSSDIVCRYGGEEFVILLPDTEVDAALNVSERLRFSFETGRIITRNCTIRVTASMGVASMNGCRECDIDELLRRADDALYRAKLGGRNQVKVWEDGMTATALLQGEST